MGLFTMFIKIRAHRGKFLNEKADRWADEGREDIDEKLARKMAEMDFSDG